jgi:hypothetical protein
MIFPKSEVIVMPKSIIDSKNIKNWIKKCEKVKKEPIENFFSEGARETGLGANESRGLGLHDARVKSKNRRLVMELACNLC